MQLKLLRPLMEKTFPGVKVYLACRDDCMYLLAGEDRILSKTELKEHKHLFGYIRELLCDMQSHPVESFMNESDIPCGPICEEIDADGDCVLLTNGVIPVRPLNGEQIKKAINHIRKNGCEPQINGDINRAGWVVGVECEQLYLAAAVGKRVSLIPTGFGEKLFKKMFPKSEILILSE